MEIQDYQICKQEHHQLSQTKISLFENNHKESFQKNLDAENILQAQLEALKGYFLDSKSCSNDKKFIKKEQKVKYGISVSHLANLVCKLLDERNKMIITKILQIIRQKEVIWDALVSVFNKGSPSLNKQLELMNFKQLNKGSRERMLEEEIIFSNKNIPIKQYPENTKSTEIKMFLQQHSQMLDQNEYPAQSIIIIQTKINKNKNPNQDEHLTQERISPGIKSKGSQFIRMIKEYVNRKINEDLVCNMENVSVGFSNNNFNQTSQAYYTPKIYDSIFNNKFHKKIHKFRSKINKTIILVPQS